MDPATRVLQRTGGAHPFLFVGCWNRRGPARDAVLEAIRADPASRNLVVLGGDNYYDLGKDPATKQKLHDPMVIEEGFGALGKIPVLLAFGNHNIEVAGEFDVEVVERRTAAAAGWIVGDGPERYYEAAYDDGSFLVLDTNLCEPALRKEFDAMLAWLSGRIQALQAAGRQYYVIQHEPIVAARQKGTGVYVALRYGNEILAALQTYPPLAVLCADTHAHHGVLLYSRHSPAPLRQIVVGTGGARPDLTEWSPYAQPIAIPDYGDDGVRVQIIPPSAPDRYGYLQVRTPLELAFRPVGEPQRGGTRRRGRRATAKFSRSR